MTLSFVVLALLHVLAIYRLACFKDCGQLFWQKHKLMSLKLLCFFPLILFCDLNISKRLWLLGTFFIVAVLIQFIPFSLSPLALLHVQHEKFSVSCSHASLVPPKRTLSDEYFFFFLLRPASAWMINPEDLTWDQVTKAVQPASHTVIQTMFLFPQRGLKTYPACIADAYTHYKIYHIPAMLAWFRLVCRYFICCVAVPFHWIRSSLSDDNF